MNDGTQALDEIWNNWKNENQWYLETSENDAKLVSEMTRMAESGHPLDRTLLDTAARTLANRGEIAIVPMPFVKKAEASAPTPAAPKRFSQDDASSGTLRHDGHISVLQIRKWAEEEAQNKVADALSRQVRETAEREAHNQPEPSEPEGELPISLMDWPQEEIRVLSLGSVSAEKIRRYMSRKNEETMRRMQEKARQR